MKYYNIYHTSLIRFIYIYMGKFDHDRSLFSRSLEIIWFFIREIIPFCHKIQDPAGLEKSHHPGDRKIGELINITKKWESLVGGLEHVLCFSIYWEFHTPIWLSYFSEGLKPPITRLSFSSDWNCGFKASDLRISFALPKWASEGDPQSSPWWQYWSSWSSMTTGWFGGIPMT